MNANQTEVWDRLKHGVAVTTDEDRIRAWQNQRGSLARYVKQREIMRAKEKSLRDNVRIIPE